MTLTPSICLCHTVKVNEGWPSAKLGSHPKLSFWLQPSFLKTHYLFWWQTVSQSHHCIRPCLFSDLAPSFINKDLPLASPTWGWLTKYTFFWMNFVYFFFYAVYAFEYFVPNSIFYAVRAFDSGEVPWSQCLCLPSPPTSNSCILNF